MRRSSKDDRIEHALYFKALLDSIHYGASSPFIPIYGIELGASPSEVGVIYAFSNTFLNFFQVIWGYASDRLKKYVVFIILGGFLSSIIIAMLLFVKCITVFLGLVALHSITSSMSIPAFIAYSSKLVSEDRWRRFSENVNSLGYAGWVLATLLVGLSFFFGLNGFIAGFLIASISGITGSIFIWIFCKELDASVNKKRVLLSSMRGLGVRRCARFFNFLVLSTVFGVFLSMAWPLFTITLTKVSMLSLFEISVLEIIFGLSGTAGLLFLRSHFSTMKTSMILMLSGSTMAIGPLVYAFFPNLPFLILLHALVGVFSAFYDAASLAYILESTPMEEKGLYTALYNLLIGLAFFCGSFTAGYVLEILQQAWPLTFALTILYVFVAAGRFATSVLYRRLD